MSIIIPARRIPGQETTYPVHYIAGNPWAQAYYYPLPILLEGFPGKSTLTCH